MSTEVQIQDEKKATVEADALPFEVKGEKDLMRLFDEHPKFREEFDADPKVFLEKYGDSEEREPKTETEGKNADAEDDFLADDNSGKGNKPEEKPPETVAATIEPQIETKLTELTDQLKAAQDKIAELEKSTSRNDDKKIKSELKKANLPKLEDFDVDNDWTLTEEGQEKAKKHIQALTKALNDTRKYADAYEEMSSELKKLREDMGSVRSKVDTVDNKVKETENKDTAEDHIVSEFALIDAMVKINKDVFGEKVRPVKAIEDDYLENLGKMLKEVAKSDAPITVNGSYSKEALRCLELYKGDSDKAKRFKARCKELDIDLPEDMDVLNKVYEVRGIRNNELSAKDEAGKTIKIPEYDLALQTYKGRHVNEFRIKERAEVKSAHERAIINRKSFAPETKAGAIPGEGDISQIPPEEMTRIGKILPKNRTKEERQMAYKILKYIGASDAEARHESGLDLKE